MPTTVSSMPSNVPAKAQRCQGNLFASLRLAGNLVRAIDPASRLRVDERPSRRNVKKMQTTAAATPPMRQPTATATRRAASTPSSQPRHPPRPQPVHQQRRIRNRTDESQQTSHDRQQRSLNQKQPRMPELEKPIACNVPTSRARCSIPSLKNKRRQHQRRDDKEETEVEKVFAEVGRATRRRLALFANWNNLKTHQTPGPSFREYFRRRL